MRQGVRSTTLVGGCPGDDQTVHSLDLIPHRSGDVLELRMVVPENQKKQYIYRGVCIARYNKGIRSSFKIYNVYPDGGPVVQVRTAADEVWSNSSGIILR